MYGPIQLFFFQCVPEMPKGWTPLLVYQKSLVKSDMLPFAFTN